MIGEQAGLPDDSGAQPQRTALAWNRTIVAAVLGCATAAFTAQRLGIPVVAVLAALTALVMLAALIDLRRWSVEGVRRYRLMRSASFCVVGLSVLGVVVAVRGILT